MTDEWVVRKGLMYANLQEELERASEEGLLVAHILGQGSAVCLVLMRRSEMLDAFRNMKFELQRSIEMDKIKIRMEGMLAENNQRISAGERMAYDEQCFNELLNEFEVKCAAIELADRDLKGTGGQEDEQPNN